MLPIDVGHLFVGQSLTSSQCSFDLVHCDIWRPARDLFGYRYYIVFVDDFSFVSWVYLLEDRQHVFDVIKIFFAEIMNQFSILSKVFRTDNVLEFLQTNLQDYCSSKGILH